MTASGAGSSRRAATRGAIGAGLLLVGLLCLALWRVLSGTENLPFTEGAATPPAARVTIGNTYYLAVPGGARSTGLPTDANGRLLLTCNWQLGNSVSQALTVDAETVGTKAETTIGSFSAPASGEIRVRCNSLGAVFVVNADDASPDPSGWFLMASIFALTIGAALALSAVREATLTGRRRRDDEQVERFVDLDRVRDGEVGDDDGFHVGP